MKVIMENIDQKIMLDRFLGEARLILNQKVKKNNWEFWHERRNARKFINNK